MKNLKVFQHISLDGVIQSPGRRDEDPESDFTSGGWSNLYKDEKVGKYITESHSIDFDLILGRKTFDIWSNYWPKQSFDFAQKFNGATKYVVTNRPQSLNWDVAIALSENFVSEIKKLKEQEGRDLFCWGSSRVMPELLKNGLVDELVLIVYPVLIGSGKRIFDDVNSLLEFNMNHSIKTNSGIFINSYSKRTI